MLFGTVSRKPGSGRRESITQATKDMIVALHERDPFRSAVDTSKELNVSRFKVHRVLKSVGIKARSPAKKPRLYDHHKEARIRWCEQHLRWTRQDWRSVLFSDESSFTLSHSEMRSVVYRRTNERYDPRMIVETTNKGYGCVMVWGGIIGDRKTRLVKVEGQLTSTYETF